MLRQHQGGGDSPSLVNIPYSVRQGKLSYLPSILMPEFEPIVKSSNAPSLNIRGYVKQMISVYLPFISGERQHENLISVQICCEELLPIIGVSVEDVA